MSQLPARVQAEGEHFKSFRNHAPMGRLARADALIAAARNDARLRAGLDVDPAPVQRLGAIFPPAPARRETLTAGAGATSLRVIPEGAGAD